jgi:hypothetical protein
MLGTHAWHGSGTARSATSQIFPPARSRADQMTAALSVDVQSGLGCSFGASTQLQTQQKARMAAAVTGATQSLSRSAASAAVMVTAAPKRLRPIFYAEHMSRKQVQLS